MMHGAVYIQLAIVQPTLQKVTIILILPVSKVQESLVDFLLDFRTSLVLHYDVHVFIRRVGRLLLALAIFPDQIDANEYA